MWITKSKKKNTLKKVWETPHELVGTYNLGQNF